MIVEEEDTGLEEEANNVAVCPQELQAPQVVPPQQEVPQRDPGWCWDDTSDFNYEPSFGGSSAC